MWRSFAILKSCLELPLSPHFFNSHFATFDSSSPTGKLQRTVIALLQPAASLLRSLHSLKVTIYLPTYLPTYSLTHSLTHSLTFTQLSLFEQINTRSVKLIVRICLLTFLTKSDLDQLMIYHQTNLWIKNLESITT